MSCGIPRDVLYEIFGHLDDKATIDHALAVVPDIVHSAVRHIRSPRVVEVSVSYLTAFRRLEHATNVLVRTKDLDTLRPLSHLRSLCVEVFDAEDHIYCIQQLVQIFGVADKRHDQFFVFKVQTKEWTVCYRNAHCVCWYPDTVPPGFTVGSLYSLRPRCYYDLLQGTRPYVDDRLGRILDIVLKHRHYVDHYFIKAIAEQVGERFEGLVDQYMRDFIAGAVEKRLVARVVSSIVAGNTLPWDMLHYYDIPDRPASITKEEEIVEGLG